MTNNQHPQPDREGALLVPSSLLKTTAPASSPAPGNGVYTKPAAKSDPMLAAPTAATTTTRPTTPPPRFVEHQIPIFGRARIVYANDRAYLEVGDAAKITGLRVADITELPDWVTITRFGLPAVRCWPAFRHFNIGGTVYKCIDAEALLPTCRTVRGGEYLTRFLLQCVLPPASATQALGLNERVPDGQFTTAVGQFVSQRFYNPEVGEIRAIVTGTTALLCAESIAKIIGVPVSSVVTLAGASNFLTIPSKYLLTPIKPGSPEVYIRPEAATRVMRASASLVSLARDIQIWIDFELLAPWAFHEAGEVVGVRGLHRVVAPASDFHDWVNAVAGPEMARLRFLPGIDAISTKYAITWIKRTNYASLIVWHLLRDGGVCHGGRVGETADEALARIHRIFPDENGQVSARALHRFLRRKRAFEFWLRAHSPQLHAKLAATKNDSRVRGDVLLSEEEALALLLQSIKDTADFRTTLTAPSKP